MMQILSFPPGIEWKRKTLSEAKPAEPAKQPEQPIATVAPPEHQPLVQSITGMFKDFEAVITKSFEARLKEVEANMLKKVAEHVEDIEDEAAKQIRTNLGITEDPVIHLSEVGEIVRKIYLEEAGDKKKSETIIKNRPDEGPTDGQFKFPPIEQDFEKMKKDRGI